MIESSQHIHTNRPDSYSSHEKLEFGFIPYDCFEKISDKDNWKHRCLAAEAVYTLSKSVKADIILERMSDILDFLDSLICDENYQIKLTALSITGSTNLIKVKL